MALMTVGEVFLESISSGVITENEISWVASHQGAFARHEEALALRLGRLIDEGQINLGCRLPSRLVKHQLVLMEAAGATSSAIYKRALPCPS